MKKIKMALLTAAVLSTVVASSFAIGLFRPAAAPPAGAFEYRVKWICATFFESSPQLAPPFARLIGLVPGEYLTDINVHNPSHSANLTIVKKFVVSAPEPRPDIPQPLNNPTAFATATLPPDGSLFIDCNDISLTQSFAGACPITNPVASSHHACKGFLIISGGSPTAPSGFRSPDSLDVVAEYSAESYAPNSTGNSSCLFDGFPPTACSSTGISLDVERVSASPFVP